MIMMKNAIYTIAFLLMATALTAQAPQSFNYQAVARDAGGQPVPNTQLGMQISILQGSASGTSVYTETLTPTTNNFGVVNLEIGNGTEVDANGAFAQDFYYGDSRFLSKNNSFNVRAVQAF